MSFFKKLLGALLANCYDDRMTSFHRSDDGALDAWIALQPHPQAGCGEQFNVRASVSHHESVLELSYLVSGEISTLNIPGNLPSMRRDDLWQHTCAEVFLATDAAGYCEFNFSPSSQWAAYQFTHYRGEMRVLDECPTPRIHVSCDEHRFIINVSMKLPLQCQLPILPLGLSMVLEDNSGRRSYWALRHDTEQPDFHRRENWIHQLQLVKEG